MKVLIAAFIMLSMVAVHAGEVKEPTEIEKQNKTLQTWVAKRTQYLEQINLIELEIIKVQAVIAYITEKEKTSE